MLLEYGHRHPLPQLATLNVPPPTLPTSTPHPRFYDTKSKNRISDSHDGFVQPNFGPNSNLLHDVSARSFNCVGYLSFFFLSLSLLMLAPLAIGPSCPPSGVLSVDRGPIFLSLIGRPVRPSGVLSAIRRSCPPSGTLFRLRGPNFLSLIRRPVRPSGALSAIGRPVRRPRSQLPLFNRAFLSALRASCPPSGVPVRHRASCP